MSKTTATTLTASTTRSPGTDRLLLGSVLGILTFWLFAGTVGTVAPAMLTDINAGHPGGYLTANSMNLVISVTALFSGMFVVVMGGLADRYGRVRMALLGNVLGIAGSLLLVLASGPLALPLLLVGRAIQGLSAACVMPATLSLVRTYWSGAARQRAVSMWSMGSWGGGGMASLFGGAIIRFTPLGWRAIFLVSIAASVASILLIRVTPESRASNAAPARFDLRGVLLFVASTLALMIVLIFGAQIGWTRPITLVLGAVGVLGLATFVWLELQTSHPFLDFALFRNPTFTGATVSNFLLNGSVGIIIVSQQLFQLAGCKLPVSAGGTCAAAGRYTAWDAGLLTLGYAITIIALMRVGEKALQRFGPRLPMLWGTSLVATAGVMLMFTNVLVGQYAIIAAIAYTLFGIGLAIYATPSTDGALANLPASQAGAGAGIYKMASSLGSAIGAAVSLAIFNAFYGTGATWIGDVLADQGRTDNIAIRQAATIALLCEVVMMAVAFVVVASKVPKGVEREDSSQD